MRTMVEGHVSFDLFSNSENDDTQTGYRTISELEDEEYCGFYSYIKEKSFLHFMERVSLDEFSVLYFIDIFENFIGMGNNLKGSPGLYGLECLTEDAILNLLEVTRSRSTVNNQHVGGDIILSQSKEQLEKSILSSIGLIFTVLSLLRSVTIKSTRRKFLKNYLHSATSDMIYSLLLLWLHTQHPTVCGPATHSNDSFIFSFFPEFNKHVKFECAQSSTIMESFWINIGKYTKSDQLVSMANSHIVSCFISFLVSGKQYRFLRRFISVLLIRIKFIDNVKNEKDFEDDKFCSYHIRLLIASISFAEGIQYSFPNQNNVLNPSFFKVVEELTKCTYAASLLNYRNLEMKRSSLIWQLSSGDSQELFSVSFFHSSLETLKQPLNYFQSKELAHLIRKCNILELLKSTEKQLPFRMGSELCLKMTYELLTIIKMTSSIGIINDLHRLVCKCYCNLVEYSLKIHCLEDCTSAISLLQRYISVQLVSDKSLYEDSMGMWRNCVRLAVIHACNFGKLDWLCSTSFENQSNDINLGRKVMEILYLLAKSTDIQRTNVACGDISYYECLSIYLLSSNDCKEASRVMYMYYDRIKSFSSIHSNRHVVIQLWALSMCAHILFISHDQEYLLLNMTSKSISMTHRDMGCMDSVLLRQIDDCVNLLYSEIQLLPRLYVQNLPPIMPSRVEVIKNLLSCGLIPHAFSLTRRHDKTTIPYIAAALMSLITDACQSRHYSKWTAIRCFETESSFSREAVLNASSVEKVIDFLCKFDKREHDSEICGSILSTQATTTSLLDELIVRLSRNGCLKQTTVSTSFLKAANDKERGFVNFFDVDRDAIGSNQLVLSQYFENLLLLNI